MKNGETRKKWCVRGGAVRLGGGGKGNGDEVEDENEKENEEENDTVRMQIIKIQQKEKMEWNGKKDEDECRMGVEGGKVPADQMRCDVM